MWNTGCFIFIFGLCGLINGDQSQQLVNCASCFSQQWEWSSWQCDVHCNTQVSSYGSIDAFSVGYHTDSSDNLIPIVTGVIFKWDKIHLNIQGSYDPDTGIFTTKIAGIYHMIVTVFSAYTTYSAPLGLYINRADGSGEEKLCDAHAVAGHLQSTCVLDYELEVGDELYTKGVYGGQMYAQTVEFFSSFTVHILYKKL